MQRSHSVELSIYLPAARNLASAKANTSAFERKRWNRAVVGVTAELSSSSSQCEVGVIRPGYLRAQEISNGGIYAFRTASADCHGSAHRLHIGVARAASPPPSP